MWVRFPQGVPRKKAAQSVAFFFGIVLKVFLLTVKKYAIIIVTFWRFPNLIVERTVKM